MSYDERQLRSGDFFWTNSELSKADISISRYIVISIMISITCTNLCVDPEISVRIEAASVMQFMVDQRLKVVGGIYEKHPEFVGGKSRSSEAGWVRSCGPEFFFQSAYYTRISIKRIL